MARNCWHHGLMSPSPTSPSSDADRYVHGADAGRVPGRGARAMVVEDEEALANVVKSYLENDGFEVSIAHDGPSAVSSGP